MNKAESDVTKDTPSSPATDLEDNDEDVQELMSPEPTDENKDLETKESTLSVTSKGGSNESIDKLLKANLSSNPSDPSSVKTNPEQKKQSSPRQQSNNPIGYKPLVGEPVKILEIDPESKQIIFYENELKEIFERHNALDKYICVCSIAGDYRKGKSFLLNYCLRFLANNHDYLNKIVPDLNNEWLGHVDEPLVGFSWRSGVDLETTGIWIWSELYPCKVLKSNFNLLKTSSSNLDTIVNSSKVEEQKKLNQQDKDKTSDEYEDAFICLIDSQGAFDEKSTISDCAIIFSILFLISSMQIHNVFHQLQEDNLQYLQIFTEYGRLIYEEGIHCKPFQRLTFLIRDWFSPSQFDYGSVGGEQYLIRKFQPETTKAGETKRKIVATTTKQGGANNRQSLDVKENINTRRHIQRCFDKIDCFLLPHPGKFVSSSSNYNGNWGDMGFEFCLKLKEFVEWWFNDLQLKRSTDYVSRKLNGLDFITLFKLLTVKLSEHQNEALKPITLFDSMSKISHIYAMDESVKQFQTKMQILFGPEKPFVWPHQIEKVAKYLEERTRIDYLKKKKFGNRQFEREFIAKLNDQFNETYNYYQNLNELKCTVLPAYLLIICTIVFTQIASFLFRLLLPLWPLTKLLDWLMSVQLFFLFVAVCVELFGFKFGTLLVHFIRRRLQFIYHLARARAIDLSALNHIK